jgi:glucose-1-phosphate cytidylyltransferase
VTVAETGQLTPTGGRVKLIEKYIKSDKFLCTYGDGLANINISELVDFHDKHNGIATITGVKPPSRFGILDIDESHLVSSFLEKPNTQDLINGGYFIFDKGVFNFLKNDSVLEQEPMTELVANGQLHCFQHNGFWQPMDTYREFEMLNKMWNQGTVPWRISK